MRIALFAAALATCAGWSPPPALAQLRPSPVVIVIGEASISVPPDTALITAGVTTQAKTAREASEANGRAMTAVFTALKDAGIAEADIQTSRLSIQPMRDQHMNPREAVSAFRDCGAELALAHHFGTFKLTDEAIDAPLNALKEALRAAAIAPERFRALRPGQVLAVPAGAAV